MPPKLGARVVSVSLSFTVRFSSAAVSAVTGSLLVLLLHWSPLLQAAEAQEDEQPVSADDVVGDPLGRSTPRGTVEGFLRAIDEENPARAAEYLDLRNLPPEITQYTPDQLARGLSIVLSRGLWFDLDELSQSPEGHASDQLPSYRDLLVELPTPDKPIRVLLQRVPDGEGGRIWKFSNATMAELDMLYEKPIGTTISSSGWPPSCRKFRF